MQAPSPVMNSDVYVKRYLKRKSLLYQCPIKTQPGDSPLAVLFSLKQARLPVGIADPQMGG